ncbi:MAG: hypothetical protein ACOYON_13235, partial [Fimbriimonas sp.]
MAKVSTDLESGIDRAVLVYINEHDSDDHVVEEELEGLCEAANVEPIASMRQRLDRPINATFIG